MNTCHLSLNFEYYKVQMYINHQSSINKDFIKIKETYSYRYHTLARRITPIFFSCQWCSTRLLDRVHRDFYKSCVRQPQCTCVCEAFDQTTIDSPFQRSSLLLFPCNVYQYHRPHSDNLMKSVFKRKSRFVEFWHGQQERPVGRRSIVRAACAPQTATNKPTELQMSHIMFYR